MLKFNLYPVLPGRDEKTRRTQEIGGISQAGRDETSTNRLGNRSKSKSLIVNYLLIAEFGFLVPYKI